MRSPQFRKQTGFIRKKTTQDSQSGSQDELSSYRAYGRPIQEAHRYVYPSLGRESYGQLKTFNRSPYERNIQRSSGSSRSSSSDFDKFDMSESMSYEFGAPAGKQVKVDRQRKYEKEGKYQKYDKYAKYERQDNKYAKQEKYRMEESSFSLSPYEQSDLSEEEIEKPYAKWQPEPKKEQKWQPDSKKVYDQYAKNPIRQESSQQQISVDFRRQQDKRERQQKIIIQESQKKPKSKWPSTSKPPVDQFQSSEDYSPPKKLQSSSNFETNKQSSEKKQYYKEAIKQRSSSSSSSFSLNSDSPNRETKVRKPVQKDNFVGKNDKTATFNKQLKDFRSKQSKQVKFKPEENEEESQELISEYDTKEFKGGSMKERMLNAYMSRQREEERREKEGKYVNSKREGVDRQNSNKDFPRPQSLQSRQSHSRQHSSQFNTKKSTGQLQQEELIRQPQIKPHQSQNSYIPRPQKFEMDVKVKHMSLAQAFQIRCGRLRRRLQQQREQFKHGNYAKMFKQIQQQNNPHFPNQQLQPVAARPINKNAQRLTMGMPATVNKKEMLKVTKKKYKQLPEVKHRMNEEKKKQDLAKRMQQVKRFDREVRLRLKYGARH